MLFKVLNTKAGVHRGTAFAYAKKKSELKRLKKIETRGLSRVMWGKDLPSIGAEIPNTIQRLMRKSSRLSGIDLSEIYITKKNTETELNFVNNSKNVERYAKIAEKQGYKKILNGIMRELRKLVDRKKEI